MQTMQLEKKRKEVDVSEARRHFADLVSKAGFGGEHVVLVRNGKRLAALIPYEDLLYFERLEDEDDVRVVRERSKKGGKLYTAKEAQKKLKVA